MAKYMLKAYFLTNFPSTQKKWPKIYAVALVLPLYYAYTNSTLFYVSEVIFNKYIGFS